MSSSQQPSSALEGFKRLSRSTHIFEPPTIAESIPSSSSPDLILIFAWMEAAPRHIAKYTSAYKTLYPHARILLITTSMGDMLWRPYSYRREARHPALQALLALPPNAKILLAVFSNGGASSVTEFAHEYRAAAGRALPIAVEILDSCPGSSHLDRSVEAFTTGFANQPVVRFVAAILLRAFLLAYVLVLWIRGTDDRITLLRARLNDEDLFDADARRLYLYGDQDTMVFYRDIEDHAEEAEQLGWRCTTEKFKDGKHVGHMMMDAARYWRAVRAAWDGADSAD
ncbi:MAG: hypothetical protein M1818_006491 [Claussenomyces sp. TS43310]|nr:MAG: hypothetical protein M1818_006491 [Claussenomyces sp. TS43310]